MTGLGCDHQCLFGGDLLHGFRQRVGGDQGDSADHFRATAQKFDRDIAAKSMPHDGRSRGQQGGNFHGQLFNRLTHAKCEDRDRPVKAKADDLRHEYPRVCHEPCNQDDVILHAPGFQRMMHEK